MSKKSNSLMELGIRETIKAIDNAVRKRKPAPKPKKESKRKTVVRSSNYLVAAPSAMGRVMRSTQPLLNGKSTFKISHREMVDSAIVGSSSWTQQVSLLINPGNGSLFPWLSSIADSFEFYRFNRLRFQYIPLCASTTVGSIQMAPDYNASNSAPVSELIFGAYTSYVDCNAWTELICDIDVRALNQFVEWHYISSNSDTIMNSNPIYAAASFYLYTVNFSGANTAGKLYVDYEIELKTPSLPPAGAALGGSYNSSAGTSAAPLSGGAADANNSGLTVLPVAPDGHSHVLFTTPGVYLVVAAAVGTGLSGIGTIAAIGGATISAVTNVLYDSAGDHVNYSFNLTTYNTGDGFSWTSLSNTTLTSSYFYAGRTTPV